MPKATTQIFNIVNNDNDLNGNPKNESECRMIDELSEVAEQRCAADQIERLTVEKEAKS